MPEATDTLREVFLEVVEQLAFMFGDPAGEDECVSDQELLRAEVAFSGPRKGRIQIAAPRPFCRELAANMLGTEPGEADEDAADALAELANTLGGHFVTAFDTSDEPYDLSPPETTPIDGATWGHLLGDAQTVRLMVDGEPVLLDVRLSS